jgi:hypothetical protein
MGRLKQQYHHQLVDHSIKHLEIVVTEGISRNRRISVSLMGRDAQIDNQDSVVFTRFQ